MSIALAMDPNDSSKVGTAVDKQLIASSLQKDRDGGIVPNGILGLNQDIKASSSFA